jgi:hypothetical protein
VDLDVYDLYGSVQTALFGHQRFIDTARMEIENSRTGHSSSHTFLVIAGIGMDAEVVGDTNDGLKKRRRLAGLHGGGVRHLPGAARRCPSRWMTSRTSPEDPQRPVRQLRPDSGRHRLHPAGHDR